MQKSKERGRRIKSFSVAPWPTVLELSRSESGGALSVIGVISIGELSDGLVSLATHGGRVTVRGSSLTLTAFANRTVEVRGKIEGVDLGYGGS